MKASIKLMDCGLKVVMIYRVFSCYWKHFFFPTRIGEEVFFMILKMLKIIESLMQ